MWKSRWRTWARGVGCSSISSDRIAGALDEWLPEGATVAGFFPLPGEPDLGSIIDGRRRWLAPRVEGEAMTFHRLNGPTETKQWGLTQPTGQDPPVRPENIDVTVIAALAYDRHGYRLGRGGGYYDRLLAAHPALRTIGVIPAARFVETLPRQSHDQPVASVVTESGVFRV